jgi:predicted MPP superfamily phosphohydrolase
MNQIKKAYYDVPSFVEAKIVLVSDIHYYNYKMKSVLETLLQEIEQIHPDYICIPGDFIDERKIYEPEIFLDFLKKMGLLCPVMISIGNHDVKKKNGKKEQKNKPFFKQIDEIDNVHLLDNTSFEDDVICFTGLTLPLYSYQEKRDSYQKTLSVLDTYYPDGLPSKKYHIVLSHSPFTLIQKQVRNHPFYKDANLILSGHIHGGLAPLCFLKLTKRGFVSPEKHWFPKYAYGYILDKKTVVTCGFTRLSHANPFRNFNFLYSREIVILSLKKEEV